MTRTSAASERNGEAGFSLVFIGMGCMAFVAASMLAIDVGMLMTARSQAQNSADAGALAGATALAFDSWDDRSPSGPAVQNAIATAQANAVMGGTVSVTSADVEFLNDALGTPSQVRVTVRRDASRGNPVSTMIAQYFGIKTANIIAVATGEASPANAMTCVKPFTIPDKWIEKQDAPWDMSDSYDAFNNKGVPLANPDIYIPAYDSGGHVNPAYTGYNNERERGQVLKLRAGTGSNIMASFYFSLAMTSDVGGDDYRWNIANCNTSVYEWGDPLVPEPGDKAGPTLQGILELIDRDSSAVWDDSINGVKNSAYGTHSPRVFPIPLFDPIVYDSGKRNGRTADLVTANWIGFFAERVDSGNNIWGRIIPIAGIRKKDGAAPNSALPKAIRLVQ